MNPFPGETYESWCKRVELFEHGAAMKELALGKPVEQVMEKMAKRLMDKLMYPIFKSIKENASTDSIVDMEDSKQTYKEKYLDKQTLPGR